MSARADGTLLYTECEESTKDLGPVVGPRIQEAPGGLDMHGTLRRALAGARRSRGAGAPLASAA